MSEASADAIPTGSSYMLVEHHGRNWADAEKSPVNDEDDAMCWAAAASNVLEWTGWGKVDGINGTDQIFAHFQDHWTDGSGWPDMAWQWWFDGTDRGAHSYVDVPGGGAFYTEEDWATHYHKSSILSNSMAAIDEFLHAGYGIALGLAGDANHMITGWGFNYNPDDPQDYWGVWVTDSDDDKNQTNPPDRLRYYEVEWTPGGLHGGRYYLRDYFGLDNIFLANVYAFEPVPEPAVLSLLLVGAAPGLIRRRRRRHR